MHSPPLVVISFVTVAVIAAAAASCRLFYLNVPLHSKQRKSNNIIKYNSKTHSAHDKHLKTDTDRDRERVATIIFFSFFILNTFTYRFTQASFLVTRILVQPYKFYGWHESETMFFYFFVSMYFSSVLWRFLHFVSHVAIASDGCFVPHIISNSTQKYKRSTALAAAYLRSLSYIWQKCAPIENINKIIQKNIFVHVSCYTIIC